MPDTPRVGFVTASLSPAAGGLFFVLRDLANGLKRSGIAQSVYGLSDAGFVDSREAWQVDTVAAFDGFGPRAFRLGSGLSGALIAADLDVVHLHGVWNAASLAAWRWRRKTRRPLVISPHGMLDPGALAFSALKKRVAGTLYEHANLKGASVLHALNDAEAAAIRRFGIEAPIAVISSGIDLPPTSDIAAREWASDRRKTMLFLARLHPKKGAQELVSAWRLMLDRTPALGDTWRLLIAGWDDGGLADALRHQIAQLQLEQHVTLPGAVFGAAKHAMFASAHAFILPSHSEGLPVSVLEAWSFGLPVFMTDACNLPIGFAANAAIRIDTAPPAIADILASRLPDAARLCEIGAKGRTLVETDFGWHRVIEDHIALYRWAANGGSPPAFVRFDDRRGAR